MKLSRRDFLRVGGAGTGSLVIGLSLSGCASGPVNRPEAKDNWVANAWLELTPQGNVLFTLDRVEMGQGTYTGMTTLIAEELDVDPQSIRIEFAPVGEPYVNPLYKLQVTGGSTSTRIGWDQLRKAGAGAHYLLVSAAARVWSVPRDQVSTREGRAYHPNGQDSLGYGELVTLAARESLPDEVPLKQPSEFRYIGKHNKRLDALAKVTGTAEYGIDVRRPGMLYAVVVRPPMIDGEVGEYDAEAVKQQQGVQYVLTIPRGVAIVADGYWNAHKAAEALNVQWQTGDANLIDNEAVFKTYHQAAEDDSGVVEREDGDVEEVLKGSGIVRAEYEHPFLAHATMEPMNCTAEVTERGLEIWAPTQGPDVARVAAARVSSFDLDEIFIHTTFMGGGFGRRLTQEYVEEAAAIAARIEHPVKVVWSREDDIRHDKYRPAMLHRLQAKLEDGKLVAWDHQIVGPQILNWYARNAGPVQFSWAPEFTWDMIAASAPMAEGIAAPKDMSAIEGAVGYAYDVPNIRVRHTHVDAGVPISYWRSVGHSHNGFTLETFMDELAHQAGKDPLAFRRDLLSKSPRDLKVLEEVARLSDWGSDLPKGQARGVAVHKSFDSYVAQVVEAGIDKGQIRIHRVYCVVDCGRTVNPDIVRMQMESGIIFGLTAALYGRIDFQEGRVQQSNFNDYKLLTHVEAPKIDVRIVDSDEHPMGVGEPGVPPVIPALGNALFALTGRRQRRLPFIVEV
ncbi:xanthine dehydrogenase family protein molybdopterin-binding subunit [Marinobacteraceae bacterium S3BR75-40.1]